MGAYVPFHLSEECIRLSQTARIKLKISSLTGLVFASYIFWFVVISYNDVWGEFCNMEKMAVWFQTANGGSSSCF